MTQKDLVVVHLNTYDSITPLEALTRYGIMRLADVVFKLKADGYHITTTMKEHDGRRYASYRLGKPQYELNL
jgi:hypothetical protein